MRRIVMVLAMAVAVFASATIDQGARASSDPGRSNGHGQLVQDPSGQLVKVARGTHTPGQPKAKKDPPPAAALTAGAGTGCTFFAATQYYCRAGAYQYVTVPADGAYMSTPVQSPVVASADHHSLAELAVESKDGQQIIEIGWRVYPKQDQTPRLFIYHWIHGKGVCYNTDCANHGFVQSTSTTIRPNMALTSSSTPVQFAIEYFQGNWWYGYNGTWFGYLPGSLWGGTFTKTDLVQVFGEVSSTTTTPCTNMGNGAMGTSTSATAVTGVGYYNTTTAASVTRFTPDDSTLYDSQVTSANSFRYGGPGAC
ncbi:MAG: neprosin family prolyl endopeptidase [Jatrophihabitantaceae bacterium]